MSSAVSGPGVLPGMAACRGPLRGEIHRRAGRLVDGLPQLLSLRVCGAGRFNVVSRPMS